MRLALKGSLMDTLRHILFVFVAKPWHILVFAAVSFFVFYFIGRLPDRPTGKKG